MSQGSGAVVFDQTAYASARRRALAAAVDFFLILLVLYSAFAVAQWKYVPPELWRAQRTRQQQDQYNQYMRPAMRPLTLGWFAFIAAYHVGLRRLRGGTVGYRLARVRLVDATGRPPGGWALTKRFAVALPAVGFFGLSYFCISRSPRRQTMHDLVAGTWVVLRRAEPAAPGKRVFTTKFLGTYPIMFQDVEPLSNEPAAPVEPRADNQPVAV